MKVNFFSICLSLVGLLGLLSAACSSGANSPKRIDIPAKSSNVSTATTSDTPKNENINQPINANSSTPTPMSETKITPTPTADNNSPVSNPSEPKSGFFGALDKALSKRGKTLEQVCTQNDAVAKRILAEYGAIFLSADTVQIPSRCIFESAQEVGTYQATLKTTSAEINGAKVELQTAAMQAYLAAREEAKKEGLDITPRGGAEASRRSFDKTVELWKSRVDPGLDHWKGLGKISADDAAKIKSMALRPQVDQILQLESRGFFFNKDFSRTILSSVAAPGSSQHLSMLALDVEQFDKKRVREIMASHGWFRTVRDDTPHFTYLGANEADLPALGLVKKDLTGGEFWFPNVQ